MQLKFPFPADRDDRFDNFVSDNNNSASVRICEDFVRQTVSQPFSIVLHGPTGAGKTHLLAAMGAACSGSGSGGSALYMDGGALVDKIGAMERYEDLKKYLQNYERASFLAVDRLDMVAGDRTAEDQVFHLYNAVTQRGGKFATALRTPPARWRFAKWLTTRLLWGHVVNVAPVGDDMRVEVLRKMAADMRLLLPEQGAVWLINHLPRDPKTQLQALRLIDKLSLTTGRKVSIPLIKQALESADAD